MQPVPPPDTIPMLRAQVRRGSAMLWLGLSMVGGALLRLLWIGVRRILGVLLAVVVLFEQWGWRPLAAALSTLSHLAPIAALENLITRLPPYAALVTFALPAVLLIPLKLTALYLIANGHALSATLLFVAAKVVGTAIVARLYQLTEPKLRQIDWVRHVLDVVVPKLHAIHEAIRQSWAWRYGRVVKMQVKRAVAPIVARIKQRCLALITSRRGSV